MNINIQFVQPHWPVFCKASGMWDEELQPLFTPNTFNLPITSFTYCAVEHKYQQPSVHFIHLYERQILKDLLAQKEDMMPLAVITVRPTATLNGSTWSNRAPHCEKLFRAVGFTSLNDFNLKRCSLCHSQIRVGLADLSSEFSHAAFAFSALMFSFF